MDWKKFAVAGAMLAVGALPVRAQFGVPQRSSASVGVNNLAAPVPTPLLKGKKAFISYELGDVTSFPSRYSGGPERAYSEFLADMKAWGRYEIVMDPKDADVIFAIRFVDPPEIPKPQIRVGIIDPATHASLWGFVERSISPFARRAATPTSATRCICWWRMCRRWWNRRSSLDGWFW